MHFPGPNAARWKGENTVGYRSESTILGLLFGLLSAGTASVQSLLLLPGGMEGIHLGCPLSLRGR